MDAKPALNPPSSELVKSFAGRPSALGDHRQSTDPQTLQNLVESLLLLDNKILKNIIVMQFRLFSIQSNRHAGIVKLFHEITKTINDCCVEGMSVRSLATAIMEEYKATNDAMRGLSLKLQECARPEASEFFKQACKAHMKCRKAYGEALTRAKKDGSFPTDLLHQLADGFRKTCAIVQAYTGAPEVVKDIADYMGKMAAKPKTQDLEKLRSEKEQAITKMLNEAETEMKKVLTKARTSSYADWLKETDAQQAIFVNKWMSFAGDRLRQFQRDYDRRERSCRSILTELKSIEESVAMAQDLQWPRELCALLNPLFSPEVLPSLRTMPLPELIEHVKETLLEVDQACDAAGHVPLPAQPVAVGATLSEFLRPPVCAECNERLKGVANKHFESRACAASRLGFPIPEHMDSCVVRATHLEKAFKFVVHLFEDLVHSMTACLTELKADLDEAQRDLANVAEGQKIETRLVGELCRFAEEDHALDVQIFEILKKKGRLHQQRKEFEDRYYEAKTDTQSDLESVTKRLEKASKTGNEMAAEIRHAHLQYKDYKQKSPEAWDSTK